MGQIDKKTIRIEKAHIQYKQDDKWTLESFRKAIMDNQPSLLDIAEEDMSRFLYKLSDKFGGEFLWRKSQHLEPQQKSEEIAQNPKRHTSCQNMDICIRCGLDKKTVKSEGSHGCYLYGDKMADKHMWKLLPEQQQEDKKIEEENIMYDYGFQAGRLYEKQHPSDNKAEVCEHRFINTNHLCTYCGEQVFTEPQQEDKKIEPLNINEDKNWMEQIEDKINEIILRINKH